MNAIRYTAREILNGVLLVGAVKPIESDAQPVGQPADRPFTQTGDPGLAVADPGAPESTR